MGLRRLTATAALCAAGCVAQNPAFGDTTGSAAGDEGRSTSSAAESATGRDTDTSGHGTHGSTEQGSGTTGSSGDETSSGSSSGSSSGIGIGETTTDPSTEILLWLTAPVSGDFAQDDADLCEAALVSLGAVGVCLDPPVYILGSTDEPLPSLPRSHPFLAEGEVVTMDSREVLAESFGALAESTVSPNFVTALSGPPPALSLALTVWWGPTAIGETDSCANWTDPTEDGATRQFASRQTSGAPGTSPCEEPHRILCACPGQG